MGRDRSQPERRLTVAEAATELGITAEAVRSRIKRKSLRSVKEGSTVYVLLPADRSRLGEDRAETEPAAGRDELVEQLREEISYLREENRRKDEIIMQQAITARQLTAPSEPRESHETPAEGESRGETPEDTRPVSWVRRWFGF